MRHKLTHIPLLAALLGGGAGALDLQAQEGFSYYLKSKGGLHTGKMQESHFDNKIMGFGFEVRKEMALFGKPGTLSTELTWEFVPGRHHSVLKQMDINIPEGGIPALNLAGLTEAQQREFYNNPIFNIDARKEYGQGFSLKFAYNASLQFNWLPDVEWYGGLSIDFLSTRTEADYTLYHPDAPGNWEWAQFLDLFGGDPGFPNWMNIGTVKDPTTVGNPWGIQNRYQGDSLMMQSIAVTPGFFAGLRYKVNKEVFCEVSMRNFGTRHNEYTPGIYFGSPKSRLEKGTSRSWSFEFALSTKI